MKRGPIPVSFPSLLLLGPLVTCALAQREWVPEVLVAIEPQRYTAWRCAGPIQVDGALDEPSWQSAPWTQAFVDIEGQARPTPRFRTRAKMLWDEERFYVAALLEEPHVWATLQRRDAVIFHDNDFEVFIDPDGDTHNYYEYEVNAFATQWDLLLVRPYRDGGPPVDAWDIPGLQTATRVYGTINQPADTDEGWSVEIAFPWDGLRQAAGRPVPPRDGDVWRVNFSRVEWQVDPAEDGQGYAKRKGLAEDNWVWSPQGLVNMHFPEQWGYVRFATASVASAPGSADDFERPAPEEGCRLLREIYWRQHLFHERERRFAQSLDSLGVAPRSLRGFLWPPRLRVTEYGYEAWVEEATDLEADGQISRWLLTEDSRVRKVAARPE